MIIDRLYEEVNKKGIVCVGLDTAVDYVPKWLMSKFNNIYDAVFEFNKRIIDATEDVACCYKVQIAYYEALGIEGMNLYKRTLEYLKHKKLITICDIKRSDISSTASMYARAHFEGDFEGDFITLNPYMGVDSVEPYLEYLKRGDKGVFILLKTSNKGANDIQMLTLQNGKRVFEEVGDRFKELAYDFAGESFYSNIGFVVGCTNVEEASVIRERYKNNFFLIPGYGAQGGSVENVQKLLNGKNGGVVNSSRAILLAYKKYNDEINFDECSRKEALNMREEILSGL